MTPVDPGRAALNDEIVAAIRELQAALAEVERLRAEAVILLNMLGDANVALDWQAMNRHTAENELTAALAEVERYRQLLRDGERAACGPEGCLLYVSVSADVLDALDATGEGAQR